MGVQDREMGGYEGARKRFEFSISHLLLYICHVRALFFVLTVSTNNPKPRKPRCVITVVCAKPVVFGALRPRGISRNLKTGRLKV